MGKYPVISLSLKDVEGGDFETAYDSLGMLVSEEATRFAFLKESDRLQEEDKARFRQLMAGTSGKQCFIPAAIVKFRDGPERPRAALRITDDTDIFRIDFVME